MTEKPEFALADKAISSAAAKIEQAMVELLETTPRYRMSSRPIT
jgi:hypothetical protein